MLNGVTGLIVVINAFSNTDIGYYCTYSGVGGYTVKALLSSKGAICRCCRTATRNPFSPALLSLQDRCFYLSLSMEHYPILCSFSFHCLYPIIFLCSFLFLYSNNPQYASDHVHRPRTNQPPLFVSAAAAQPLSLLLTVAAAILLFFPPTLTTATTATYSITTRDSHTHA